MSLPPELTPRVKSLVMDLAAQAGIDVSDWSNYGKGDVAPGANPAYCYEWALKEPGKLVLCNLWSKQMLSVAGEIEQHLVLLDTDTQRETNSTRRARRDRMATLLTEAYRTPLPVRVIVLDGKTRDKAKDGKTHVRYRALDPVSWVVMSAETTKGRFVLRRGAQLPTRGEEVADLPGVPEGAKKRIVVNAYERDPTSKPRCLKRWGTRCMVCDFDFASVYGELGAGFIHVHHLRPIHTVGELYVLDPENDLRPVCPNCHAMLHRQNDVLAIEELRRMLRRRFDESFRPVA
jgi:hypothetical protein